MVERYIGWLPNDTVEIDIMPLSVSIPYLHVLQFFEGEQPVCIEKLAAALDALPYVERRGNTPSTMLLHGHPDRDALESCATDAYKKGGVPFTEVAPISRRPSSSRTNIG